MFIDPCLRETAIFFPVHHHDTPRPDSAPHLRSLLWIYHKTSRFPKLQAPSMPPRIRHVLVTGGSRGIGLSIAQLFAQNAYRCTLLSRSEANLERALQTLDPLESAPPGHAHSTIAGDVSSASFWSASQLGAALKSRGDAAHIDVLVNCAGITQSKLFTTTAPDDIRAVIDTNLTSLMLGTRFLLRSRLIGASKRGRVSGSDAEGQKETNDFSPVVINVASLLGLQGGYGAVAYAASKAGVLGFTRALAGEYASHGVRVNAVVPGYVETDMTKGLFTFAGSMVAMMGS
jgi:NAD(P)-dependent dehydrogenase (short-subunit alcohol dehydrogenase family)